MDNILSSPTGNNKEQAVVNVTSLPVDNIAFIDLNGVVQNNLAERKDKIKETQAIIRYDVLPQVRGDASGIIRMFQFIFNSILEYPPAGTKLFIYIRCERHATDVM